MLTCKLGGISETYERAIQHGIEAGIRFHKENCIIQWDLDEMKRIVNEAVLKDLKYELSMAQEFSIVNALILIERDSKEKWLWLQGQKTGYLWYDFENRKLEGFKI